MKGSIKYNKVPKYMVWTTNHIGTGKRRDMRRSVEEAGSAVSVEDAYRCVYPEPGNAPRAVHILSFVPLNNPNVSSSPFYR